MLSSRSKHDAIRASALGIKRSACVSTTDANPGDKCRDDSSQEGSGLRQIMVV